MRRETERRGRDGRRRDRARDERKRRRNEEDLYIPALRTDVTELLWAFAVCHW